MAQSTASTHQPSSIVSSRSASEFACTTDVIAIGRVLAFNQPLQNRFLQLEWKCCVVTGNTLLYASQLVVDWNVWEGYSRLLFTLNIIKVEIGKISSQQIFQLIQSTKIVSANLKNRQFPDYTVYQTDQHLGVLRLLRRRCCLCSNIDKWPNLRVFLDKDVKP